MATEKKKKSTEEVSKVKAVKVVKAETKAKKTAAPVVKEKKVSKPTVKQKEKAPKAVAVEEAKVVKKFAIPSTAELLSQMRSAQRMVLI